MVLPGGCVSGRREIAPLGGTGQQQVKLAGLIAVGEVTGVLLIEQLAGDVPPIKSPEVVVDLALEKHPLVGTGTDLVGVNDGAQCLVVELKYGGKVGCACLDASLVLLHRVLGHPAAEWR